jgi:hypothetical protein
MPYTAKNPQAPPSSVELRARIPGWGADLDPANRPAVPKEAFDPASTGAHWDFPDQQPETRPRERSIEHKHLTPVFGTSTPPRGLSGAMRKYSYRRFSEARAAHWLILIAADRVDAIESHLRSFLTLHPDNPITETGVLSEFTRKPVSSRVRQKRADLHHNWIDPVLVGGPWIVAVGVLWVAVRTVIRMGRR